MVIELGVVQFWSEIILVISNFEIPRMLSDQIALHSVQLPLLRPIVVLVLGSLKAPRDWTCESRINYVDNTSRDFLASRS